MNIDEKWKTDPRRKQLVKRLRSDREADGMLVEITWVLFSHKGEGIPFDEFRFIDNHEDWLACGLGYIDGDWVRIAGSDRYEEFFDKQSQNGSKGGRPRKNPTKPNETQNNPDQLSHNPEKPSVSSSVSISQEISAVEARARKTAAAHAAAPGGDIPGVIQELLGNSRIEETLINVPQDVQRDWVVRWETKSVKDTLLNGINHYMTESGARLVSEIDDWNVRLVSWIKREKKTLMRRRTAALVSHIPSSIDVPESTVDEILSSIETAKKKGFGSSVLERLERQAGGTT